MMTGLCKDSAARCHRVVIAFRDIPHYRHEFYNRLRNELANRYIDLTVIYGQPVGDNASGWNTTDLDWGTRIRNHVLQIRGRTLCWQPIVKATSSADLVIVEQANRLLVNYVLLARQRLGGPPVAFWGHGRNFQAGASMLSRLSEVFKRRIARAPAWWFAYTEGVRAMLMALGYPSERITVVQNSTNICELKLDKSPSSSEVAALYKGNPPDKLCLYVGELEHYKGIDLLLAAADRIAAAVPEFGLGIIGAGRLRRYVEQAASSRAWLQVLDPLFGRELATMATAAQLLLLPKGVGLAAVDSFAMGLPILTIVGQYHGPEFEYLTSGVNSVILDYSATANQYADRIISLLSNGPELERLRAGARASAEEFGTDRMVARFADGVEAALDASQESRQGGGARPDKKKGAG
jgi:glycosyltransferase involved in cell wall biosynthesis